MYVLGIDPGLTVTGYGVVAATGTTMHAVAAGVIRTDADQSVANRLLELAADLEAVLGEHPVQAAAVEQVFVNRNLHTATAVGRASGVAILACARAGIEVFEYTPSAVKMAVAGSGTAPKDQVQRMVARRLGLGTEPQPADAADALAVAICHLQAAPLQRAVEGAGP
ncbi:MAG TPA: crossover junction endodeoxyribonuclease RuvC [Gemmatimonadales bacterium]|nr:crossover junction endodeoxyribonuclease RuvC [Gemmatimonadales bacterium]